MKFKLSISNKTNKQQKARILNAINRDEKNFGLPEGLQIELKNKKITYEKLLEIFTIKPFLVKFTKSTNNRQLYFGFQNAQGFEYAIEPHKNIDKTPRERYRGEKYKLGNDVVYEGDLFVNYFIENWNPKKWNIADTGEMTVWAFSNFIELNLKRKQIFELEFIIIK